MPIQDSIIDYIERNRVSTTEVADCLGKTGLVPDLKPITPGSFAVGKLVWTYAYGETNWHFHEQAASLAENHIVITEAFDCRDRAIYGDIVAKYLLLYRRSRALLMRGKLRDAHRLIKERWPIWCEGFSPIGCFNDDIKRDLSEESKIEARNRYDGAIAVCDDSGVVIIPVSAQTDEFLEGLDFIEHQEDIWYDCIDRRKWSTFETICQKRYLDEPER